MSDAGVGPSGYPIWDIVKENVVEEAFGKSGAEFIGDYLLISKTQRDLWKAGGPAETYVLNHYADIDVMAIYGTFPEAVVGERGGTLQGYRATQAAMGDYGFLNADEQRNYLPNTHEFNTVTGANPKDTARYLKRNRIPSHQVRSVLGKFLAFEEKVWRGEALSAREKMARAGQFLNAGINDPDLDSELILMDLSKEVAGDKELGAAWNQKFNALLADKAFQTDLKNTYGLDAQTLRNEGGNLAVIEALGTEIEKIKAPYGQGLSELSTKKGDAFEIGAETLAREILKDPALGRIFAGQKEALTVAVAALAREYSIAGIKKTMGKTEENWKKTRVVAGEKPLDIKDSQFEWYAQQSRPSAPLGAIAAVETTNNRSQMRQSALLPREVVDQYLGLSEGRIRDDSSGNGSKMLGLHLRAAKLKVEHEREEKRIETERNVALTKAKKRYQQIIAQVLASRADPSADGSEDSTGEAQRSKAEKDRQRLNRAQEVYKQEVEKAEEDYTREIEALYGQRAIPVSIKDSAGGAAASVNATGGTPQNKKTIVSGWNPDTIASGWYPDTTVSDLERSIAAARASAGMFPSLPPGSQPGASFRPSGGIDGGAGSPGVSGRDGVSRNGTARDAAMSGQNSPAAGFRTHAVSTADLSLSPRPQDDFSFRHPDDYSFLDPDRLNAGFAMSPGLLTKNDSPSLKDILEATQQNGKTLELLVGALRERPVTVYLDGHYLVAELGRKAASLL